MSYNIFNTSPFQQIMIYLRRNDVIPLFSRPKMPTYMGTVDGNLVIFQKVRSTPLTFKDA